VRRPHTEVVIAGEQGVCLPEGQVGEIYVQGTAVARGYFGRPVETELTFGASVEGRPGNWLRTGDLGFLYGGELYLTGRCKDLILWRGRNLYPQDLEQSAERAHPEVRPGCVAAFEVERDGETGVVIAAELRAESVANEAAAAVRRAVAFEHDLPLVDVVMVRPRTLPKTSSGKLRRQATRGAWLEGSLQAARLDAPPVRSDTLPEDPVTAGVAAVFAQVLGVERVGADTSFAELGGDSLRAATAVARIEERFGVALPRERLAPFTVRVVAGQVEERLFELVSELDDEEVARRLSLLEGPLL
jgi:acyl carrier protein